MWGLILEVFWTSLNKIGLKFLIHLSSGKCLQISETGQLSQMERLTELEKNDKPPPTGEEAFAMLLLGLQL